MASAQAAQPVKKNATKIPRQKASARANSTFVQFESCRPMSRYHQSAALVFFSGRRCWDGTAGAGGRALLFRPSSADYGTLKVENFLFDRRSQHQDLDTGRRSDAKCN
jgi:hypothetical protein